MTTSIIGFISEAADPHGAAGCANIIRFPTDRCRPSAAAIEAAERAAYEQATAEFSADPSSYGGVLDIMRLALNGKDPSAVKRASDWLLRNVGVLVRLETC